jgi:ABC-type amino acid transport substrate-binding protein
MRAGLLILAASLAASGATARPLDKVRQTGELRVTVYQNYRPFSWRESGEPVGVDIDIAKALADALHVRLSLFELRADDGLGDDLRNGVWKGTVLGDAPGDVMLHVPYDKRIEERNDRVALFAPYHVDGLAMFVDPAKAAAARDLSLLRSDKAAVAVGTVGDYVLISTSDHAYLPQVVHEPTLEAAAGRFERGDVAAFYGEESAGESLARAGKRPFAEVRPQAQFARDWSLGVAVKSDSRDLGREVERTMDEMARDGRLRMIFAAYGIDWRRPEAAR